MDTLKIGQFLKQLRKEQGLTQEQLGEKIGVTNKTISRWENGNYMPPVECLTMLSDLYGLTINEILSGQRLEAAAFQQAAEDNLKEALSISEQSFKKSEKRLIVSLALSTVLAILIILLLPVKGLSAARSLLLVGLVAALAFISGTVNFVALVLNKERFQTER